MSNKIIGIDLDDTLYSFCAAARAELAEWDGPEAEQFRKAAYTIWTDWRSADDLCGGGVMKVIERVHEDESILSQEPFPDAVDTVRALDEAGHRLVYISSRDPKCWKATYQWLDEGGVPVPGRDLSCTEGRKTPPLAGVQCIMDDRPKTLVEFVYDFQWKYKHGSESKERQRRGFGLHVTQN